VKSFDEGVEELQKLLEVGLQYWLLGAGASVASNIPLMYPLTQQVSNLLVGDRQALFAKIQTELPSTAHVEHVLSHLGDLIALADRSRSKAAWVVDSAVSHDDLKGTYQAVVAAIATTVRYGYKPASGANAEVIGSQQKPIVEIDAHREFVKQLFKRRANLESRSRVGFVTTNYDTLLEDALALEKRVPIDGFAGSAIAHWTGAGLDTMDQSSRCHRVLKLHGSVDWFNEPTVGLLRVRYGVSYLADLTNTLIYPQATKYIETQKDPFAKIFECFRRSLSSVESHVLAIVGYSFGDDHINTEIENALGHSKNKTNIVAFSKEVAVAGGGTGLCPVLDRWTNAPDFGPRIYVATDKALYCAGARLPHSSGTDLGWWTFAGMTKFLEQGVAL